MLILLQKRSVLKQVPEGDELVKINRTVYLTINRHVPPMVEMPNIVGFSFRNAEMALKNMGLRIGDTTYVTDFAKNSVLEQHYHNGGTISHREQKYSRAVQLILY